MQCARSVFEIRLPWLSDLYDGWLSKRLNYELLVETWQNGRGNIGSNCTVPNKVSQPNNLSGLQLGCKWLLKQSRFGLLVDETEILAGNHRPVAIHWHTLSHIVVSSTPRHERGLNSQQVENPTTMRSWPRRHTFFVKEHHFYCCSTFPSHSQDFNELSLYPKMGVKRSPTCSWPVLKLQQKYRYIQMIIKKNIHRFTLTKKGIVELRGLFFLKEHRYARLNW